MRLHLDALVPALALDLALARSLIAPVLLPAAILALLGWLARRGARPGDARARLATVLLAAATLWAAMAGLSVWRQRRDADALRRFDDASAAEDSAVPPPRPTGRVVLRGDGYEVLALGDADPAALFARPDAGDAAAQRH